MLRTLNLAILLMALSALLISLPVAADSPGQFFVTDFGAVGNGVHDDTSAFQAAVDAAAPKGAAVIVPPTGGGEGYVLTGTVTLHRGVSLIGSLAGFANTGWAAYPLPDTQVTGVKIFARPKQLRRPLFQLEGDNTLRGFWILYDQQPMPSDAQFQDPHSPYYYSSFQEARSKFIRDHVKPFGPTIYVTFGDNTVIEDIAADRYYDFFFLREGAKVNVSRINLYGYNKAFVIRSSFDVNRISQIHCVPNVGPTCPCTVAPGETYSWIYGIIVSNPDNVGIHIGISDWYDLSHLSFFGVHTGIRLGASKDYPIYDPVQNETWTNPQPASGPWGLISSVLMDQTAVGIHFVWSSTLGNYLSDISIFPSFDDGTDFLASAGTGNLKGVAQQAVFLVEPTFSSANNDGFIPTVLVSNLAVSSFQDTNRFASAAASAFAANGRVFLVGGDITMEVSNFFMNPPYGDSLLIAAGAASKNVSIRIRGFVNAGRPDADVLIDRNGKKPLP